VHKNTMPHIIHLCSAKEEQRTPIPCRFDLLHLLFGTDAPVSATTDLVSAIGSAGNPRSRDICDSSAGAARQPAVDESTRGRSPVRVFDDMAA
jgi:hypothetical protein